MSAEASILIGRVAGAHGVRGQIRLIPLTDFPERFHSMESVDLYRDGQALGTWKIIATGELLSRRQIILTLEGLGDRDAAQALQGCEIRIAPEERVPLEEGQYWISDLVGLEALDDQGNALGTLTDVGRSGAADLLEITDFQGKVHLIPMVEAFVKEISLERRQVVLHLIDGLW